ncbi:hypothetical protein F5Y05DRAFT_380084 [Hypoxylon sp. FL0543]|nr:hypothetical protein F5Y05DRAFT_380084 [Hypoxylon sp. FL0543]
MRLPEPYGMTLRVLPTLVFLGFVLSARWLGQVTKGRCAAGGGCAGSLDTQERGLEFGYGIVFVCAMGLGRLCVSRRQGPPVKGGWLDVGFRDIAGKDHDVTLMLSSAGSLGVYS